MPAGKALRGLFVHDSESSGLEKPRELRALEHAGGEHARLDLAREDRTDHVGHRKVEEGRVGAVGLGAQAPLLEFIREREPAVDGVRAARGHSPAAEVGERADLIVVRPHDDGGAHRGARIVRPARLARRDRMPAVVELELHVDGSGGDENVGPKVHEVGDRVVGRETHARHGPVGHGPRHGGERGHDRAGVVAGLGPVDEAHDDVRRRLGADAGNREDAGDEGDGGEDGSKGALGSSCGHVAGFGWRNGKGRVLKRTMQAGCRRVNRAADGIVNPRTFFRVASARGEEGISYHRFRA